MITGAWAPAFSSTSFIRGLQIIIIIIINTFISIETTAQHEGVVYIMDQRVSKGFVVEGQKRFSSYECLGIMVEKCCFHIFLITSFGQSFPYVRVKKGKRRGEGQT